MNYLRVYFEMKYMILNNLHIMFEKWRAIRASTGGVGGALTWVGC